MTTYDFDRLDDPDAITAIDASDMLRAVATSAAQVRASREAVGAVALDRLDLDQRPRAVLIAGMGGSGISGDVFTAVAGPRCPVPVLSHRGYGLPSWVGAGDFVFAVSCSGTTQETCSAVADVARRGARLVTVGAADTPISELSAQAGGVHVPITPVLSPRSSMWALSVPLLVVGARMGLLGLGPQDADLEAAAVRLEEIAGACRPDRDSFVNPAKGLATALGDTVPMVWGSGQVGPVAANRMLCQLAENAKLPAVYGALPEAHHNQVVTFDGPLAAPATAADIFADPVDEPASLRLRLVTIRDDSHPYAIARAEVSARIAEQRRIPHTELATEGESAVERLASVVGLVDHASAYLGIAAGIDPSPITPIDELKAAMA